MPTDASTIQSKVVFNVSATLADVEDEESLSTTEGQEGIIDSLSAVISGLVVDESTVLSPALVEPSSSTASPSPSPLTSSSSSNNDFSGDREEEIGSKMVTESVSRYRLRHSTRTGLIQGKELHEEAGLYLVNEDTALVGLGSLSVDVDVIVEAVLLLTDQQCGNTLNITNTTSALLCLQRVQEDFMDAVEAGNWTAALLQIYSGKNLTGLAGISVVASSLQISEAIVEVFDSAITPVPTSAPSLSPTVYVVSVITIVGAVGGCFIVLLVVYFICIKSSPNKRKIYDMIVEGEADEKKMVGYDDD
jgi:hypothetical protein